MKPRGERRMKPSASRRAAPPARRRQPGRGAARAPVMLEAEELAIDSSFSSKVGSSKTVPADASPDSKCPICLDRFENVSYLDRCLHRFCFRCIQEWAKNKAECPLCKQPFYSIFHSVKAEDDFQEFVLRPSENGSFGSPDGHRFRYRSTLTQERRNLLHNRRSAISRTVSPPDNGILFEGLAGQPPLRRDNPIHEMIRRLASRRQASAEGRSMRQIQEQDIINFRRALYRSGVHVRGIEDGGRFRDISAEFYRRNPACLHRLVPWLKRELTVLFGAHGSLVNIVQHIIMSNVTRYDLESQAFADELRPFLLHRTDHFLHELISFARCPYNMEAYDQHSNYDCPAPSYEEGSHSDSTVITISPDEAEAGEQDVPLLDVGIGESPWDDETPGPSYSTLEQGPTTVSSLSVTSESSDEEVAANTASTELEVKADPGPPGEESSPAPVDDCLIVGFVKPLAERTPELVELSSDSEGSLYEMKSEDTKKPEPTQFHLFSDDSNTSLSSSQSSTASKNMFNKKIKRKNKSLLLTKSNTLKKGKTDKRSESLSYDLLKSSCSKRNRRHASGNHELLRKSEGSRSSGSVSRSSHGRGHKHRKKHHSKERVKSRSSRSRERGKQKSKRDKKRFRSRDRSLSRRSQTVSITSGSSKSIDRGRSRSRSRDHGRSRSRDNDFYPRENYRSSYQWEYTYYSRNRDRDGYEQSYRSARGHHMASPEYRIQSYSERKNTWDHKNNSQSVQHHRERRRSRSPSSNQSRITTSGTDWSRSEKPSGKRKYKTRHLEHQEGEASNQDILHVHGKEKSPRKTSPLRYSSQYKNEEDLSDSRVTSETKHKRRKKTRSPSVEIVYEGKANDMDRHRKKKKRKHKKKHKRHHPAHSTNTSPVVITIDSDSDGGTKVEKSCNQANSCSTATPMEGESSTSTALGVGEPRNVFESLDEMDILATDDDLLDRDWGNTSSSGHLDAATGILDDFHLDESSNDQPLGAMEGSDSSRSNVSVLEAFTNSAETSQTNIVASPAVLNVASPPAPTSSVPLPPTSPADPASPAAAAEASLPASSPLASPAATAQASLPTSSPLASPAAAAQASLPSSPAASPLASPAALTLETCSPTSPEATTSPVGFAAVSTTPASPTATVSDSQTHDATWSDKTSARSPLILRLPKSLLDTTNLFDNSNKKT